MRDRVLASFSAVTVTGSSSLPSLFTPPLGGGTARAAPNFLG